MRHTETVAVHARPAEGQAKWRPIMERGSRHGLPLLTKKLPATDARVAKGKSVSPRQCNRVYQLYFRVCTVPRSSWPTQNELHGLFVDFCLILLCFVSVFLISLLLVLILVLWVLFVCFLFCCFGRVRDNPLSPQNTHPHTHTGRQKERQTNKTHRDREKEKETHRYRQTHTVCFLRDI